MIESAHDIHYFVTTRHEFYYEWIYFGWLMLPNNYPLYKNKDNNDTDSITMWVHKAMTHEENISKDSINIYHAAGNMARITVQNYVKNGANWTP